ncbi:hypothetical protein SpCBS45565_g05883 [Spizellomyces sp. 'palustris']|nr:hypothetical protein SpCBS45565_g05883 [Spizellomyces sp. 'palustris']
MHRFAILFALLVCVFTSVKTSPLSGALFISNLDEESVELFTNTLKERQEGSLIDRLRGDKRFSRFVDALSRDRGLRDDLENKDKKATVFAPTNEAFKHLEDDRRRNNDERELGDILRYHICPDLNIRGDELHQGMLLRTDLRLKKLNDRHQRIRVFRFRGDAWLNMRARIVERDMEAENGRIHAIDRVLIPPRDAREMLFMMPTEFSTFLAGAERTDMSKHLADEKGLTIFAPSNEAWQRLGFENLRYLFSCVGQDRQRGMERHRECKGVQDLKRIIQYHMGRDLAYTTDMMEKREMRLKTLYEDKTVCIEAKERGHKDRTHSESCSKDRDNQRDVRRYMFLINKGEAKVQFADGLAENGAIHMIDNVLVPDDVKLPHDRYE